MIRKRNGKTEETVRLVEGMLQKQLFLSTTGYGYPLVLVLAKAAVSRFGQRPCGISIAWLPSIDLLFRCALECVCKNDLQENIRLQTYMRICVDLYRERVPFLQADVTSSYRSYNIRKI